MMKRLNVLHHIFWIQFTGVILYEKFPQHIGKEGEYFTTTSRYGNWTNNPTLYKKDFYLNTVEPFAGGGIALEGNISKWWAKQNYKVAHGEGLFNHLDEGKHGR